MTARPITSTPAGDDRPRCRCCDRPLKAATSRALLVGPGCLARLPAGDRNRLIVAAVRGTRDVPLQVPLPAAA